MITQEGIKELFDYRDGHLHWKRTAPGRDLDLSKPAGGIQNAGYVFVKIQDKKYRVHRLIFLMQRGYLPKILDHIDGDRTNNKIENLRAADAAQNRYNSKLSKSSTSGIKGVYWHKPVEKWAAEIKVNGKRKRLGFFYDKEVAAQIVRIARLKYHGEFANHG